MNRTSQFVEVRIHSIIIDVTHGQYTHTVSRHGTVGRVRATCNLGTQFNASKSKVLFQLPVDTLLEFTLSYLEARPRARYFSVFRFNLCKRSAQPVELWVQPARRGQGRTRTNRATVRTCVPPPPTTSDKTEEEVGDWRENGKGRVVWRKLERGCHKELACRCCCRCCSHFDLRAGPSTWDCDSPSPFEPSPMSKTVAWLRRWVF